MRTPRIVFLLTVLTLELPLSFAEQRLIYLAPQTGSPSMKEIVSIATDGSDSQLLHTVVGSANLLVDSNAGKIWFRDGTTLFSSNLDGSDKQTFLPASCIASLEDPALSEDGMRIHGRGKTCSPNGGGGSGTFLFDWPLAGVIGQYRGNETVPGSGMVYSITDLCELIAMDHDGVSLNVVGQLFPAVCSSSPLAWNEGDQKLYFSVFPSGSWQLARCNLDGSGAELVSPFGSPIDMVIDSDAGKIYWTGFGGTPPTMGLYSSNMDGSGETLLAANATHVELANIVEQQPVPTVSEWGMVAMSLLVLSSATILLRVRSGRYEIARK